MSEDFEKNGIDDFRERFGALAADAKEYGIYSCVLLQTEDPISQKSHLTEFDHGDRMRSLGMLQQALWHLQQTG